MRGVETEIGSVLAKRLAEREPPSASGRLRGFGCIEDFAVAHMRSLGLGMAGAVVAVAGALSLSAPRPQQDFQADPVVTGTIPEQARVPAAPVWRIAAKPVEMIALQAPQFAKQPAQYIARQSDAGDREDLLVFEGGEAGEARIALRRPSAPRPSASLFIDVTRQQAERGVAVTRSGAPSRLATKFGDLEVADVTLADREGRSQSCLAFRSDSAEAQPFQITGWLCGGAGQAVERPELACFVDRLTLLKAGEDMDLRRYFAEAERHRRPCPTLRLSTGRKPTWLDSDGKAPAMRGEITGSIGRR
jgi:hypothetical protein